jgi:hypothetical protein
MASRYNVLEDKMWSHQYAPESKYQIMKWKHQPLTFKQVQNKIIRKKIYQVSGTTVNCVHYREILETSYSNKTSQTAI